MGIAFAAGNTCTTAVAVVVVVVVSAGLFANRIVWVWPAMLKPFLDSILPVLLVFLALEFPAAPGCSWW